MNEELDSQLSAMFDDELPSAECELLARRLSRDELLKARWGRYAVMGAVIRAERGMRLNAPLAGRVNAAISAEPTLGARRAPARGRPPRCAGGSPSPVVRSPQASPPPRSCGCGRRCRSSSAPLSAQRASPELASPALALANVAASGDNSYVTPRAPPVRAMLVPSTQLANYVVAHSMFSSPVARRNLLSAFITSEQAAGSVEEVVRDAPSDAR